ncbi:glycosyl transferase family 1 [Porphyrobacter sp. AAP60]|nr:glycosyl transferase family 1 [Porphyrobacter sp. AAP60]
MKIAIIAHFRYAIAEPFAGGLEMHTHLLAKSLRNRGHDVTLFASLKSDQDLGLEAICEETSLLQTGLAEAGDVTFFREHHAYLRLMTMLQERSFDVVHNNSLHYLPLTMAATLRAPTVTTLHTPPFCWLESGVRLGRQANTIVAVSQATADMWRGVAHVDGVIPNGIELDLFPFSPRAAATPYLVWYGRIVPEKGLHLAIDAARACGLPLKFAGPRSDPRYFDAEIAPRLEDGVDYVGHLAHRELAQLIGGARAAICTPCWEEPYGLVVAEAVATGTPVAAFRRGGIPEILDETCGALAEPGDVASLVEAIRRALSLDRAACRRRAERYCDARTMVDAYERLYRDLIEVRAAVAERPAGGVAYAVSA